MRILALTIALSLFAGAAMAQTSPNNMPTTGQSSPARTAPMRSPSQPMATGTGFQSYRTEAQAQQACGGDTVVWGNTASKVLHSQGAPYYGKTKHGGYMCERQATGAGYHMSKSGN